MILHIVCIQHKHREISPRLRLVIPLKRNVNADEYEAIGRKVADIVGMDYLMIQLINHTG